MTCMECLLSCGRHRGTITYNETDSIDKPCDKATFMWGDFTTMRLGHDLMGGNHAWSEKTALVEAVHNWNAINRWVSSDGVKDETSPPWQAGSRFAALQALLQDWEQRLDPRYRFDRKRFVIHAMNKRAGSYGFLHLVHHTSIIFLHRGYLRFFPDRGEEVMGHWAPMQFAVSQGELDEDIAVAFCERSLGELFTAASRITETLLELEARNALMVTPFMGFAAFTAATMNMYLAIFGWLCPALAPDARTRAESDVRFLKKVAAIWPVSQKWYATVLRLFDSYKSYHMEGKMPQTSSGQVVDTFHAFDRSFMDYGEITPDSVLMAAIVAAKDSDGYKHGITLDQSETGVTQEPWLLDEGGIWGDLTEDVIGTMMAL